MQHLTKVCQLRSCNRRLSSRIVMLIIRVRTMGMLGMLGIRRLIWWRLFRYSRHSNNYSLTHHRAKSTSIPLLPPSPQTTAATSNSCNSNTNWSSNSSTAKSRPSCSKTSRWRTTNYSKKSPYTKASSVSNKSRISFNKKKRQMKSKWSKFTKAKVRCKRLSHWNWKKLSRL